MTLFKLKSLECDGLFHVLDMIVSERIYLSTRDLMNDPEEGMFTYPEENCEWPESANKDWDNDWERLKSAEKLRNIVDSQRFTCFVESINNPLMWAHYAGGFRGVALEYTFDAFTKYDIRKIEYNGLSAISKSQMEEVIAGKSKPQDVGILKRKSPHWCYENEWRLYGTGDAQYVDNVKPQAVIFGTKESGDRTTVLREITYKFGVKVKYLTPELKGSEWEYHVT